MTIDRETSVFYRAVQLWLCMGILYRWEWLHGRMLTTGVEGHGFKSNAEVQPSAKFPLEIAALTRHLSELQSEVHSTSPL